MTELEYIAKLVDEIMKLNNELNKCNYELAMVQEQRSSIIREIKKAQVKEAKYCYTQKEDIYDAAVPYTILCEILHYDAGICNEALAVLREKELAKEKQNERIG